MPTTNQLRLAKAMRWAARIIGCGAAGFLLTMLIGATISDFLTESTEPIEIEGALLAVLGALTLAGCIVSWWRERLAAVLMILASLGLGIHIAVCAQRNHLSVWSVVGLPYLVAGVLLLASWQLSKRIS